MMNHDIFISYSSKQKSIADGVCHYLEENGFKCWMAPRDIPVGSEYGDLIEEAIKTCKVVVLVFSQAASISKWVKGEINVAFTENKPILPFRVDETEIKGGFRVMLNQMHWIDAFPHYADRLPDLLISVCGFLGRQPQKVSNERELEAERKAKEAAEMERQEKERLVKEARLKAELEHQEQERLAYERAEAKRKAKEEAERARLEKERIANTEAERLAREAAEKERLEEERRIEEKCRKAEQERILAEKKQNNTKQEMTNSFNGHEYVDLGLPSGTLWATCNVGADKPEDFGDYFAWGEIKSRPNTLDDLDYAYKHYKEKKFLFVFRINKDLITKYCNKSESGYDGFTDELIVLQSVDDAAMVNWGKGWRMPTKKQWDELISNTKNFWTKRNGVNGRLFTAHNGNSLFLPAAGHRWLSESGAGSGGSYWTGLLYADNPYFAWYFDFNSDNYSMDHHFRDWGLSVRAVREN